MSKPTQLSDLASLEAEQALIGSVLIDPHSTASLLESFPEDHFYYAKHKYIWTGLRECQAAGAIDFVLLIEQLERDGHLKAVGGAAYITHLINTPATAIYAEHHAKNITHLAARRAIYRAGQQIVALAANTGKETTEQILETFGQTAIDTMQQFASGRSTRSLAQVVESVRPELELLHTGQSAPCVPTGIADLDSLIGGMYPSDLVLIAARPGVGKSAFAGTITLQAARDNQRVLFFSLEMGAGQLLRRLLAAESGVDSTRLRRGPINDADWNPIVSGLDQLAALPVWLNETPSATLGQIRSIARRSALQHGIDLIIVDYLQLIRMAGSFRSRAEEVGAISAGLKALARELHVPVLALSQLNRAPEARQDGRPVLADLRESGSLEQDSDIVILMSRPGLYNDRDPENLIHLTIAKHRHGPTGMIQAVLLPDRQIVASAAEESDNA